MRLEITTDGGFTGRGIGSVAIDDARATPELQTAIDNARPSAWEREYRSRGADLVRYTLTLDGVTTSWTDMAAIPGDLRELFERAWRLR